MKYKVGDKVRIKSLDWYNENKNEDGDIQFENNPHWRFVKDMSKNCGKTSTITAVNETAYRLENIPWNWTDEMIEGLVPKFKVGDIIGMENNLTNSYLVTSVTSKFYGLQIKNGVGVLPVKEQDEWVLLSVVEDDNVLEDLIKKPVEINIPDGYEFRDENGNVINATKIVLEKKKNQYPQSYEECCIVLNLGEDGRLYTKGYNASLIQSFQKLLICRDAYWKIAGEEMGLSEPWKPDFTNDDEERYGLYTYANKVIKDFCGVGDVNIVLTFSTEEMRDVFYENFKELIEQCKELL